MDLLQIALIFLIILLSIFLGILGVQVFFILRDLKKALDRLNKVLKVSEEIAADIEKPVIAAANVIDALQTGVSALTKTKRAPKKRFFKKV